jgi:hypothetical protein
MSDDIPKDTSSDAKEELEYDEKVDIVVYQRYKKYQRREMLFFALLPLLSWAFNVIDAGFFLTLPIVSFLLGLPFILAIHIGYLYTFRNKIILPLRKRLSLPRKLISSWSNRLIYVTLGSLDILLKCLPVAGFLEPLSLSILIIANTHLSYRYHTWQYRRETSNKGLLIIEKIIVFGFFGFAFACITSMCVALYVIASQIEKHFL